MQFWSYMMFLFDTQCTAQKDEESTSDGEVEEQKFCQSGEMESQIALTNWLKMILIGNAVSLSKAGLSMIGCSRETYCL